MTLDVTRLNRRVMHAKSAVGRGTRYVLEALLAENN